MIATISGRERINLAGAIELNAEKINNFFNLTCYAILDKVKSGIADNFQRLKSTFLIYLGIK